MNIKINKAPKPVGAYPHSKKVGNFLFLSGVGPRKGDLDEIPGVNKDEDVLPKAFWIIAITIKPGARNSKNGISSTNFEDLPKAIAKIIKKSNVVKAGPNTVWRNIFIKRITSLLKRV